MTVARISMVEYVSKEAADEFEPRYSEVAPKFLPEADNLILVRTAETSGMSIAIYKDEQTAEEVSRLRWPTSWAVLISWIQMFLGLPYR